jgi:prevent-host-death family protein
MADVAAQELHARTGALLERVVSGERFTITVDGAPVATLAPIGPERTYPTTAEFFASLVPADRAMLEGIRSVRGDQTTDQLGR